MAQSSLADYLDRGMLNVWRRRCCQVLMQIHDAILVQYPEQREEQAIELVREQLEFSIPLSGSRMFRIPYGVKTGWNWGVYSESNPDGLKTYHHSDHRRRQAPTNLLDRHFYRTYG